MIGVTTPGCDNPHEMWIVGAGQERGMTSHPLRPSSAASSSDWRSAIPSQTHSQLIASLRAGIIALVLLGGLALIVLM
jgi:hypothetical protein